MNKPCSTDLTQLILREWEKWKLQIKYIQDISTECSVQSQLHPIPPLAPKNSPTAKLTFKLENPASSEGLSIVTERHYHSPLSLVEVAVVTLSTNFSVSLPTSRGSPLSCIPSTKCFILIVGLPADYDECISWLLLYKTPNQAHKTILDNQHY